MAFFRFTRDKRGYEHFYLVEPVTNRKGRTRSRVLYWYRTPPNVRVGREPFDQAVRRALETQNPGITFDWRKILETPIPSADVEMWRERRRAERAEKAARRALAADTDAEPSTADPDSVVDPEADSDPLHEAGAAGSEVADASDGASAESSTVGVPADRWSIGRRRRRRRGGGGAPSQATADAGTLSPGDIASIDSGVPPDGDAPGE